MTATPLPGREHPAHDTGTPVPPNYDWRGYGFDTRQVHAGEAEDAVHQARITPVYLSAAFRFDSFQQSADRFGSIEHGQLYSRNLNPTHAVAEGRIASLENGVAAIVVSSGQAAVSSVILGLLEHGDHLLSAASIYSGTRILFGRTLARAGIDVDYVWDHRDEAEWESRIRPETKAIFAETIPNPKNDIVDIPQLAAIARRHGIPLIVDNTIATPYLARPIDLGADIVIHSGTKFLSGHGAALSGVIVDGGTFDWQASPRPFAAITEPPGPGRLSAVDEYGPAAFSGYLRWASVNDLGAALSPLNSFLLQQGIETLSLRLERHVQNAQAIAEWLSGHPAVESVDYAGLPDSPYRSVALRDLGGRAGSVFSFTVRGGIAAARRFYDSVRVFSRMTNIGDVRSMVLHPATTTHQSFEQEVRDRLGIGEGLIRLSVGIESAEDLIADLDQALAR